MSVSQNKTALIRQCDGCGKITAIDLDNTLKNKRDLQIIGQTVYEKTEEEAKKLWMTNRGYCECGKRSLGESLHQPQDAHSGVAAIIGKLSDLTDKEAGE